MYVRATVNKFSDSFSLFQRSSLKGLKVVLAVYDTVRQQCKRYQTYACLLVQRLQKSIIRGGVESGRSLPYYLVEGTWNGTVAQLQNCGTAPIRLVAVTEIHIVTETI